jgi:hypothetical protein
MNFAVYFGTDLVEAANRDLKIGFGIQKQYSDGEC